MSKTIGAAYIRVSTDDQLEYSPESQIKLIQEYAKQNDIIVPEEYIFRDDGIRPAIPGAVRTGIHGLAGPDDK